MREWCRCWQYLQVNRDLHSLTLCFLDKQLKQRPTRFIRLMISLLSLDISKAFLWLELKLEDRNYTCCYVFSLFTDDKPGPQHSKKDVLII